MARIRKKEHRNETEAESPQRAGIGMRGPAIGFVFGFAIATALWKFGPLAVPTIAPAPLAAADIPGMPPARFVPVAGRPSWGPEDAPITIVEFTDYECPFCQRHATETYPMIKADYGGRIRYVVRNFPLSSIHPHAQKAAEAAECAFDQGLFWEYHDKLFAEAPNLQVELLKQYAIRYVVVGALERENIAEDALAKFDGPTTSRNDRIAVLLTAHAEIAKEAGRNEPHGTPISERERAR